MVPSRFHHLAVRPGREAVAEREIVAIVWHEHTHSIDMVYVDGHPDTLMGTKKMAAQMAGGFGLDLIPTSTGTVLWVRPLTL